ncbi:MAG: hydrogenase [Nitrospirae bacterium CG18_big_fil_WC_8_21_14_2_50_70_55]|nr:hydrogenase 4 subunit F [Deltaproteobacteria bacterium]OIP66435.1 MAG: hypothetical protein AUK30_02445 [Nitrospirae bacterium CG2_30_70_394]PIQ05696.1 MAG: hydrogenase [Nitrospirae bacterium CG18_big_fil_WC_8_21_14_2_50_70_55]PIU79509.1 MAG: hydrogenase [Nitrospirae bacterium CG06_land_8_20_14_3_00_70_43]PIW83819.1 MAG: hydrogenase [Nitrospirae bacterium CG_4_8_14_3_um_filter_70_85]PIX82200.1 MAG: hydrogenase [Nitrospirae bacterium CG_4_10_14_3_um_filter_70_108]PJB96578.1 MAG: hydrogenase
MFDAAILWSVLLLPAIAGTTAAVWPWRRGAVGWMVVATVASAAMEGATAVAVWQGGRSITTAGGWLFADGLSAFHLAVMAIVFTLCGLYSLVYFSPRGDGHPLAPHPARRFAALWLGAQAAMTLLLVSNNLGLMWVGMESTTLLTAFLVSLHPTKVSLEATWKYLMICSVGIAFAFMGTLIAAAAVPEAGRAIAGGLLWTVMMREASHLDPTLMRIAFVFLAVGYGTKAGLAPMHNWLPDAHSQAPGPVSAMFSSFMLNAALFCILRYLPITRAATGTAFASHLLVFFGVASIVIAAAFILSQSDAKRLLAYCSVEHLGIICLAFGLGPLGAFAGLFHTLNHAVCKSLAFFSVARLGQRYGSHDMTILRGALRANRVWGIGLLASFLALIGVAPFAILMSELALVRAAVHAAAWLPLVVFLGGGTLIFITMLRRAIHMTMGAVPQGVAIAHDGRTASLVVWLPILLLLTLGLWMPQPLRTALQQAAAVVGGTP